MAILSRLIAIGLCGAAMAGAISLNDGAPLSASQASDWPFPSTTASFVNETGVVVDGIEVYAYPATNFEPLTDYPAGCGPPSYQYVGWPYAPVIVTWPSACVDPGESVAFMFGVDCQDCPAPSVYDHVWLLQGAPISGDAMFHGYACLNGSCGEEINGSDVVAKIGGVECGFTVADYHDGWEGVEVGYYEIDVVSAQDTAGCGTTGAVVEFYIEGVRASQTGTWEPGGDERIDLMAGGDFAAFSGSMQCGEACECDDLYCIFPPVRAYVDLVQCGYTRPQGYLFAGGAYVLLAVKSADQQAGCGTEGATISFTVNGKPAKETGAWTPGFQRLDLTALPEFAWGDVDCSGQVTPIDSLDVLKADAGELHPSVVPDCPWPDDRVLIDGTERTWADVDCSGSGDPLEAISPVDALKLLMMDAGIAPSQPAGCPKLGVPVEITHP